MPFMIAFIIIVCAIVYLVYVLTDQNANSADAPHGPATQMPLRRFYHETEIPPDGDYTVLDVETTGIDACTYEILELGAVRVREHKGVEEFHSLVRPEGAIPQRASDINGITWAKVRNAPVLENVLPQFLEFLGQDVLVGYNVGFDIKFIQTRSGQSIKNTVFDVLPFVRMCINLDRYRLEDVKQYFCLDGRSHSAVDDCLTTMSVLEKCLALPLGQALFQGQQVQARIKAEVTSQATSSSDQGFQYWEKGEEARIQGDLGTALHLFDLSRDAGYSSSSVYTSYAMAYRKLKDYDSEISILNEALSKFTGTVADSFQARKSRAEALLEAQRKRDVEAEGKRQAREQKSEMKRRKKELEQSRPKKPVGRPVIQCSEDGTALKEFKSISEAATETGINGKSIREAATGKQKHAGGYCWKFPNPEFEARVDPEVEQS